MYINFVVFCLATVLLWCNIKYGYIFNNVNPVVINTITIDNWDVLSIINANAQNETKAVRNGSLGGAIDDRTARATTKL